MYNTTLVLQVLLRTIAIINARLAILLVANSAMAKLLAQFVTRACNSTKKEIFVRNAHHSAKLANPILTLA